jgi:hypothetical protein
MAERNNLTPAWQDPNSTSTASERTADEIRQDIAARRESITEAVDRLSDRFQRTLDWRAYVSDHPLVALGVAAGLGFLTAKMFAPRQSPGDRIREALADGFEDFTGRFKDHLEDLAPRRADAGVGSAVKAAATGLITKAVTDYVRSRVAGGHERGDEYDGEYAEYAGGYPVDDEEYADSEIEAMRNSRRTGSYKKGSEPRH